MGVDCTLQSNYWSTLLDSLSYLFRDYHIWVYVATKSSHRHYFGPSDAPKSRVEHFQFANTLNRLGITSNKVDLICNDRVEVLGGQIIGLKSWQQKRRFSLVTGGDADFSPANFSISIDPIDSHLSIKAARLSVRGPYSQLIAPQYRKQRMAVNNLFSVKFGEGTDCFGLCRPPSKARVIFLILHEIRPRFQAVALTNISL